MIIELPAEWSEFGDVSQVLADNGCTVIARRKSRLLFSVEIAEDLSETDQKNLEKELRKLDRPVKFKAGS